MSYDCALATRFRGRAFAIASSESGRPLSRLPSKRSSSSLVKVANATGNSVRQLSWARKILFTNSVEVQWHAEVGRGGDGQSKPLEYDAHLRA